MFITLFLLFSVQTQQLQKYKNFFQITKDNVDDFLNQWDSNFIYLHKNDDCPFCQMAIKSLNELAIKYNDSFSSRNRFGIAVCDEENICSKISTHKPPTLMYKLKDEYLNFSSVFTENEVKKFVLDKINKEPKIFDEKNFKKEITMNIKELKITAIFNGEYDLKDEIFLQFYDLSKRETNDVFYFCQDNNSCQQYFEGKSENVLIILGNRKLYLSIEKNGNFKNLVKNYRQFKNPFYLDFNAEFEKKVFKNMTPTLIMIIDVDDEQLSQEFAQGVQEFKNNMQVCIIDKSQLNSNNNNIYQKLVKIIGEDPIEEQLPFIFFLEPNIDTMRFNQYRYVGKELKFLDDFLGQIFKGQVMPYLKSQKLEQKMKDNIQYLNSDNYKKKVFVKDQESVIMIHEGENLTKTQNLISFLQKISKTPKYNSLKFFMIDSLQNDIPVFFENVPALLIYTQDNWEFPINYTEVHKNKEFLKLLDKRKKIVFKPTGDLDMENLENMDNIIDDDF